MTRGGTILPDMSDAKPRFANFPERELKVQIGPNINPTNTKALSRFTIGAFEMSFIQQENGAVTVESARQAMNGLAKEVGMVVTKEAHRDYVGIFAAANNDVQYKLWITTPFELTQSAHLVWVKYVELTGEQKVGVAVKNATSFSADEVRSVLNAAKAKAVKLADGEAFVLKGNPPPRFQKKAKAEAAAEAPATEAPATSG